MKIAEKIQRSLVAKSVIWLCPFLFIIFAAITLMDFVYGRKVLLESQVDNVKKIGDLVLTAMRYPMMTGDQDIIQLQFDQYKELKGVKVIHLLDKDGIIKRSTDRALLERESWAIHLENALKGEKFAGIEIRARTGEEVFSDLRPIFNEKRCYSCHGSQTQVLGVLRIALDWKAVLAAVKSTRDLNIFVSLFGLICINTLIIVFLLKIMIFPIRELEMGMIKVSRGDLNHKIVTKSKDEIGKLTDLFNKMTEELHKTMVCRDELASEVTERKKMEEVLLASENKYRTLVENLPQKIFIKDKSSTYVSCNENYARDLKIKSNEITGMTDYDFYPKELAEKYRRDDERIMESGKTEEIKEKYIQNGQEFIVHTVKTPVKDENGNTIGVLGIFWDVTELQKAQEEIRRQKDFIENVINALEEPFYVINLDYTIALANEAAKKKGIVEGGYCYELTHKEQKPCEGKHLCPLKEVLRTKKPVQLEHIHYDKDGNIMYVELHGDPIFNKDGQIVQMLEFGRDITQRKKSEEQQKLLMRDLEETNRIMTGRELRMIELKKEVNKLNEELGRPKPYEVLFSE